jgi:hypothetical protein
MKHVLKQVWSKLLTSPTCKALGCTVIAENVPPSLLLHMHPSSSWTPWNSFEMQSAWVFNTQPLHLLPCYTYPCALMHSCLKNKYSAQMHTSKLWLLRMRKAKAPTWMKLLGTNLGPNSFDVEFWYKTEFGTPFNPFVFFSCLVSGFIPWSSQIWGSSALFQRLSG